MAIYRFLIFFLLIGCLDTKEPRQIILVPAAAIPDRFRDGVKVERVYLQDAYYIREGTIKAEGQCELSRTEVKIISNHILMRLNDVSFEWKCPLKNGHCISCPSTNFATVRNSELLKR